MKRIKCFIIISVLVLILIIGFKCEEVSAINTGFETEELSEEDKNRILSNMDISVLTIEPDKKGIVCFDVSENGLIALGMYISDEKRICVYTSEGDFLYGYQFNTMGDFKVGWEGKDVIIYLVRSDMAVYVDSEGKAYDVVKIKETTKNREYWDNEAELNRRKVGDCEYVIKNDRGIFNVLAFSYSQLVVKDADGNETIIYDSSKEDFLRFIGIAIFAIGVVAIFLFGLIQQDKERRKKMESDKQQTNENGV